MAGGYSAATTNDIKTATGMAEGDILYCQATRYFYEYKPASTETELIPWVISSNTAGRWIATGDTEKILNVADASAITLDYSKSHNFALVMTTAITSRLIATPTNLIDGLPISLILKQPPSPPSGGCKITVSSDWVLVRNSVSLNPNASGYSLLQGIYYQADNKILANITPLAMS